MGVYACLLISLLLIFQTHSISSLSNGFPSISNHSFNSQPLQHHHQLLVSGRDDGEENTTAVNSVVLKAKGGKSGSAGAGTNNHRPGKAKNAAASLFEFNIIYFVLNSAGLFLFFYISS